MDALGESLARQQVAQNNLTHVAAHLVIAA